MLTALQYQDISIGHDTTHHHKPHVHIHISQRYLHWLLMLVSGTVHLHRTRTVILHFIRALSSTLQLHHTIPPLTPFRKEG